MHLFQLCAVDKVDRALQPLERKRLPRDALHFSVDLITVSDYCPLKGIKLKEERKMSPLAWF